MKRCLLVALSLFLARVSCRTQLDSQRLGRPSLRAREVHAASLEEKVAHVAPDGFLSDRGLHFLHGDGRSRAAHGAAFVAAAQPGGAGATNATSDAVGDRRKQMYFRPVSTTLWCVMVLSAQCLLVYSALAIARNVDELAGLLSPSIFTTVLATAARTNSLPPMLCMAFVGCRMYVLASTEGLGEPPMWIKACMVGSTAGTLLQFLVVLVLPFLVDPSTHDELGERSGEQVDTHPKLRAHDFVTPMFETLATVLQSLCLLLIYGGSLGVVLGTFLPSTGGSGPVSPAVTCTMVLSLLYLVNALLLWAARTRYEGMVADGFREAPEAEVARQRQGGALAAAMVTRKAPMLAVLFLASRMRAMQLDPPAGLPPFWMRCVFIGTTLALVFEAMVAAAIGYSGKEEVGYYGSYMYKASPAAHYVQHFFALVGFGGMAAIMAGMPFGHLPLSPTVQAVLYLSVLFFGVLGLQWLFFAIQDVFNRGSSLVKDTLLAAGVGISLAPMLCVLFVACRMRALQITQQQGAPPAWAQDAMYACVFAGVVQVAACMSLPAFTGMSTHVDGDGNAVFDLRPLIGAYAVTIVKFVALIVLHGGVIAICVANFTMTPETACGQGSLLPDCPKAESFFTSSRAFVRGCCILVSVVLLAAVLGSAKVVGLAVKFAIESAAKPILGVAISVDTSILSLCNGYVNVQGVKVDNVVATPKEGAKPSDPPPIPYQAPYLLKMDSLVVKLNLGLLIMSFGKIFEVTWLELTGLRFMFEKDFYKKESLSNVDKLLDNINTNLGLEATETTGATSASSSSKPVAPPKAAKEVLKKEASKREQKESEVDSRKSFRETICEYYGSYKAQMKESLSQLELVPEVQVKRLEINDIGVNVVTQHDGKCVANAEIPPIVFENFYEYCGGASTSGASHAGTAIAEVTKVLLNAVTTNTVLVGQIAKLSMAVAAHKTLAAVTNFGKRLTSPKQGGDGCGGCGKRRRD
eukprot:TRINITY_DN4729_c0_g3_i1.p1 TRINITY_DN4729_c0_g3~~TRINITY_DN4729_c0_g3_i1.p1  ORF type:complete len:976 (-),score=233.03 TRINITY_DN4729_c0_g3_i1:139-3066(-)